MHFHYFAGSEIHLSVKCDDRSSLLKSHTSLNAFFDCILSWNLTLIDVHSVNNMLMNFRGSVIASNRFLIVDSALKSIRFMPETLELWLFLMCMQSFDTHVFWKACVDFHYISDVKVTLTLIGMQFVKNQHFDTAKCEVKIRNPLL